MVAYPQETRAERSGLLCVDWDKKGLEVERVLDCLQEMFEKASVVASTPNWVHKGFDPARAMNTADEEWNWWAEEAERRKVKISKRWSLATLQRVVNNARVSHHVVHVVIHEYQIENPERKQAVFHNLASHFVLNDRQPKQMACVTENGALTVYVECD